MSNLTLHQLKIASITRETPDAVSLTFDVPTHLRDTFAFAAGQYNVPFYVARRASDPLAFSGSVATAENLGIRFQKIETNGRFSVPTDVQ